MHNLKTSSDVDLFVIGAGSGGVRAARMAADLGKLGVKITLYYRGDKLLRGFEEDLRDFIAQKLKKSYQYPL
jgi:pyruvate/2-oxoglutarate dehydrogenase complex dihydrolipoamide dehydrogenase (E3) component